MRSPAHRTESRACGHAIRSWTSSRPKRHATGAAGSVATARADVRPTAVAYALWGVSVGKSRGRPPPPARAHEAQWHTQWHTLAQTDGTPHRAG
ncbi:hypothetical protein T492DRAFT_1041609 [Pavlovales sp. CCMP2436]|nr:hypothetical protein T492DRAFT_1041609 [Pavlovales sp. CCMP2436]